MSGRLPRRRHPGARLDQVRADHAGHTHGDATSTGARGDVRGSGRDQLLDDTAEADDHDDRAASHDHGTADDHDDAGPDDHDHGSAFDHHHSADNHDHRAGPDEHFRPLIGFSPRPDRMQP